MMPEYQAPDSALPIGASRTTRDTQLVEVDPKEQRSLIDLVNSVLAVLQVEDDADEEETTSSPILGFVHM